MLGPTMALRRPPPQEGEDPTDQHHCKSRCGEEDDRGRREELIEAVVLNALVKRAAAQAHEDEDADCGQACGDDPDAGSVCPKLAPTAGHGTDNRPRGR